MFDVLTIGTATRDVFLKSPLFKAIKDPHFTEERGFPTGEAGCFAFGSKINIEEICFTTGGGATNAAVTFARQGFKTATLAKIGNDSSGEDIKNELEKEKVKSVLAVDSEKKTAYSTILLSPEGERTILVFRGASENLKLEETKKLPRAKWVYINPGAIPFEVIREVIEKFSEQNSLIAVNPSGYYLKMGAEKMKPILDKSKVIILNREEASFLTGVDYRQEAELFKKLDDLVLGIAVMTAGPEGVQVSDGFNVYSAGTYKERQVADRTGAGDSFGSGFVAGLMRTGEICEKGRCGIPNVEYAIRLGSANATSVVEYIGAKTGILTRDQFGKEERWQGLDIKVEHLG